MNYRKYSKVDLLNISFWFQKDMFILFLEQKDITFRLRFLLSQGILDIHRRKSA